MTDIKKGDKVRQTIIAISSEDTDEHTIKTDGWSSEVLEETIEVLEPANPRTAEPVGTVVRFTTACDCPAGHEPPMYVVKIGSDAWADLGLGEQNGKVRIFTDADNRDAKYVGHVSRLVRSSP